LAVEPHPPPIPHLEGEQVRGGANLEHHRAGPAAVDRAGRDEEVVVLFGGPAVDVSLGGEGRPAGLGGLEVARHGRRVKTCCLAVMLYLNDWIEALRRELQQYGEMLARFKREGEALRQLRHRNIVAFVGMFEHQRQQVIVMEYVGGGSLHQLIRHGPLHVEQTCRLALELSVFGTAGSIAALGIPLVRIEDLGTALL
jgi:hypothetical protein